MNGMHPTLTLEKARTLVGLSQLGLDRRAKVAKGTVNDLETGRRTRPSYDTVARIIAALQAAGLKRVTADQIFPVDVSQPQRVEEQEQLA